MTPMNTSIDKYIIEIHTHSREELIVTGIVTKSTFINKSERSPVRFAL